MTVDATGMTHESAENRQGDRYGYLFTVNNDCILTLVTLETNVDGPVKITDVAGAELASAANVSDQAVFNYNLSAGTTYMVVCGDLGTAYNLCKRNTDSSGSFPINGTNINYTNGALVEYDWDVKLRIDYAANIISMTTKISSSDNAIFMGCNV